MFNTYEDGLVAERKFNQVKAGLDGLTAKYNETGGFSFTLNPSNPLPSNNDHKKGIVYKGKIGTLMFFNIELRLYNGYTNEQKSLGEKCLYISINGLHPFSFYPQAIRNLIETFVD